MVHGHPARGKLSVPLWIEGKGSKMAVENLLTLCLVEATQSPPSHKSFLPRNTSPHLQEPKVVPIANMSPPDAALSWRNWEPDPPCFLPLLQRLVLQLA